MRGDKDTREAHFISERKLVREKGKDQNAYHHNDEKGSSFHIWDEGN